jgi:predicted nucleotidyltransferase
MSAAATDRRPAAVIGHLDPPATRYAHAVTAALAASLGSELLGVYLYGSAIVGDYVPGRSDVDLIAVSRRPLTHEHARHTASAVAAVEPPYPTKGLDLHVAPVESVTTPAERPRFDVQIASWFAMERLARPGDVGEARLNLHYVCCRQHGHNLLGPSARKLFVPRPRSVYLRQLREELYRFTSPWYRVLNACRDWRYLEESEICSKLEGSRWATERLDDPSLVAAAVEWHRTDSGPPLDPAAVNAFVDHVAAMLARAAGGP